MYAAEWPCCHDPLRFSLGSDDLLPRATTLTTRPPSVVELPLPALGVPSAQETPPPPQSNAAGEGEGSLSWRARARVDGGEGGFMVIKPWGGGEGGFMVWSWGGG